jgi:chorismate synthase
VTDYTIRPFQTIEDYHECVALQEETWGRGFSERVAPAILKVSQILGGVSAGAYRTDGTLVGFVFGMTGLRDGELVHWSDMLAVRPEARNRGLGTRLKAYQRDEVLALGVERMHWTFDPLRARNAHLNFNKLGIIVREYVEDMYGQTDSPLHRGIGTDRFIALWLLTSVDSGDDERTRIAQRLGEMALALDAETRGPHPVPGEPSLGLGNDEVAVKVPWDVASLMDDDLDLARSWRAATRAALTHYLAEGYEVREFFRGERASTYLLVRVTG